MRLWHIDLIPVLPRQQLTADGLFAAKRDFYGNVLYIIHHF
jgi:hypothetical protein